MEAKQDSQQQLLEMGGQVAGLEVLAQFKDDQRFLHLLFDQMFEGVQIIDFEMRYLYLNLRALQHGKSTREELLGKRMTEAFPGIDTTEMFTLLKRCMSDRTPQHMVNHFSYPAGGDAWFDLIMNPVSMGVLILSVDITDRKVVEEQIRQTQKMEAIGQLAAGIAHDFNNLIGVISGYSEMVLDGLAADSPQRNLVEPIIAAARQAGLLTRQLLAYSRKQVLQPKILNINATLNSVGAMLKRVLGENIVINIKPAEDLDYVDMDPGQLQQIILNLAVNARDAMPQGGILTIGTANVVLDEEYIRKHREGRPGAHVMLAVTDTGIGMDAVTQSRIFEPFFSTKEMGRGTGLGLSTVHGIVKQSGGNVWVYSEVGIGTTFKIYLPRHEGPAVAEPVPSPLEGLRGHGTILLVEDEAALRKLFKIVLTNNGYRVLDAGGPEEALAICRQEPGAIHLLLTDIIMPIMHGPKLAEQILAIRPGIKVAYMSGYTDDAIVGNGILEPGTAFIEKPVGANELLKKIRDFLA